MRNIFKGSTPHIMEEGSVSSLEEVSIGGINQYICIRGKNIDNPILLFLHGGPGDAMIPVMTGINKSLEDDFVVVNWEQRGAGKSYYPFKESDGIDIDTFILDAYEITKLLLKRFDKEKIYIMGNSWGGIIGIKAVKRYPELYYTYIGIGQVVNMKENEDIIYKYTLEETILRNDKIAERKLRNIGEKYYDRDNWFESLLLIRKYLVKYGGAIHGESSYDSLEKHFISSPEYSIADIINRIRGSKQSLKILWPKLLDVNLFEDSAHFPQWEEAERFHRVLVDRVVKETYII